MISKMTFLQLLKSTRLFLLLYILNPVTPLIWNLPASRNPIMDSLTYSLQRMGAMMAMYDRKDGYNRKDGYDGNDGCNGEDGYNGERTHHLGARANFLACVHASA